MQYFLSLKRRMQSRTGAVVSNIEQTSGLGGGMTSVDAGIDSGVLLGASLQQDTGAVEWVVRGL
jgi:hypothetical protein